MDGSAAIRVDNSWRARLALGFEIQGARTVLARRSHFGPLRVQKPFYPEGGACHVYVLHPPGGVVGGDELDIEVNVGPHAHALLTTPASAKFYRSGGACSLQRQTLRLAAGATMEWLPQDSIAFEGCNMRSDTRVQLAIDAHFIGWEILCLGRPASGERFMRGACRTRFELWREDVPLMLERAQFDGNAPVLSARWGLGNANVTGTMMATGANRQTLQCVRDAVTDQDGGVFTASLIDELLVCRYLGVHAQAAHNAFVQAWTVLRPLTLGRTACLPRIWKT